MSNKQISITRKSSQSTEIKGVADNPASPRLDLNSNVAENMITAITDNDSGSINSVQQNDCANTLTHPPRRHFTRQRRLLTTNQRQHFARDASLHLVKLQQRLPANAQIGLYYDGFGELPTQPLLDWCLRLNYQPYLPVVGSLGYDDKRLRFVPIYHNKLINVPTRIHSLGMKQNHHRRLLWASELDLIVCPLTVVDTQGNRTGMGGGFYDTTLSKGYQSGYKKPLKIGWCYDFQVVEQLVRQSWDVPLDGLITPSGIRWFR